MKTVAIIEARMSSSRLPGKVLMPIGTDSSLGHICSRLEKVPRISNICIATTTLQEDNVIEKWAVARNLLVYRGSSDDVMSRVLGAAEKLSSEIIVEITGDCPFVDPIMVDQFIEILIDNKVDYVSNNIVSTYPDGFDVQVFRTEILRHSSKIALSKEEREHVTMHIRRSPHMFRNINIIAPKPYRYPNLSVTLDTEEDLIVLRKIADSFVDITSTSYVEIVNFLLTNPEIARINSSIKRKGFEI